ncbi:MAG: alpha/beta hydrolase domain-containing protein, partial [Myxococcota bacterium]
RGASPEGVPDLTGSSTPFPPETLRELYPDRDAYVARFEAAVHHGLDEGFLMPRDAKRLRAEAAAAEIPD